MIYAKDAHEWRISWVKIRRSNAVRMITTSICFSREIVSAHSTHIHNNHYLITKIHKKINKSEEIK